MVDVMLLRLPEQDLGGVSLVSVESCCNGGDFL